MSKLKVYLAHSLILIVTVVQYINCVEKMPIIRIFKIEKNETSLTHFLSPLSLSASSSASFIFHFPLHPLPLLVE